MLLSIEVRIRELLPSPAMKWTPMVRKVSA
jgi:hypothetical protein